MGSRTPRRQLAPADTVSGMTDTGSKTAVTLRGVSRTYRPTKGQQIAALRQVDLDVDAGKAIAVVGASGAGKSTLLHLVGAMDRPDSGEIHVDGRRIDRLGRRELDRHRRRVGFVFQRFHLLPTLTVLDNVVAPVLPHRVAFDKRERARELLDSVGLGDRARSLPVRCPAASLATAPLSRLSAEPHEYAAAVYFRRHRLRRASPAGRKRHHHQPSATGARPLTAPPRRRRRKWGSEFPICDAPNTVTEWTTTRRAADVLPSPADSRHSASGHGCQPKAGYRDCALVMEAAVIGVVGGRVGEGGVRLAVPRGVRLRSAHGVPDRA